MGRHVTHSQCPVQHDIVTMSREELEETYNIEIDEDTGVVWDVCEGQEFDDIRQWADFLVERDQEETYREAVFQKIGRSRYTDE